eukprot:TRINITY_DN2455_c0_g1_i2.p1 TRINITY_DN2455_c0_g1~~TRINITY_DN2455_c0_g1_i2.p1  ORF type:complete len:1928 (-),score=479.76 TRINITY_DN2455_c0_g1_i2:118-5901(-)
MEASSRASRNPPLIPSNPESLAEYSQRIQGLKRAEAKLSDPQQLQNVNLEKFDLLWDLNQILDKVNKKDAEQNYSDYLNLLLNSINHSPQGALLRVLANTITVFFKYDIDPRGPANAIRSLLNLLNGKANASQRIAAMKFVGTIANDRPMQVASLLPEIVAQFVKQVKAVEVPVRVAALVATKETVEGAGLSGNFIHSDVLKGIRLCHVDKAPEVRIASYQCLTAIGKTSNDFSYLEGKHGSLTYCMKNIEDNVASVRSAAAISMGKQLASALLAPPLSAAAQKAMKTPPTIWNLETISGFFGTNFIRSTKRETRVGVSQAYVVFLQELKSQFVESNMDAIISNILGLLQSSVMQNKGHEDNLHCVECVCYILRYGLTETLGESGQQSMVKVMNVLLQRKVCLENEFMVVAVLREMGNVLLVLGEGASYIREPFCNDSLPNLLMHPSLSVRLTSGGCLRCLGQAIPGHVAFLLENFTKKIQQELRSITEAVSKPVPPEKLRQHVLHIEGYSNAVSALLAAAPLSALGIPGRVTNFAFETAAALLRIVTNDTTAMVIASQSGWSMIGALMKIGPEFVEPKLKNLFSLWRSDLSFSEAPKVEREIAIFCQMKSRSLASLCSFVANCPSLVSSSMQVQKHVVSLLSSILSVVVSVPEMSLQASTNTILQLFKVNLFKAFASMSPSLYAPCHISLLRILSKELIEGQLATLAPHLNKEDAILGPWSEGQDAVEENLVQINPRIGQDPSVIWSGTAEDSISSLQELSTTLVDISVNLFAAIFVNQSERNRQQLLDHFMNSLKAAPANRARTIQVNLMSVIVEFLKELVAKNMSIGRNKVLSTLLEFLRAFIGDPTAELRRASGEALGMLARIEGDQLTSDLTKSTIATMKRVKEAPIRAGCAFMLGCIMRYVGGMRSAAHLQSIVGAIREILSDFSTSSSVVHVWGLHSLCLAIEAAGPSFSSMINPIITFLLWLMLSEEFSTMEEYQCIGKAVHALVQVLGPELKAKSVTMRRCSAICAEFRVHPHPLVQLQYIQFEQSLILFAPQTVDVSKTVPFLRAQFASPYLLLRRAAVVCLRQLVPIDAIRVSSNQLEEQLFVMLDSERDQKLRNELQLLLSTLVDLLSPSAPSYWIQLCKKIVLTSARSQKGSSAPMIKRTSDSGADKNEEENETEDTEGGILQSVQVWDKNTDQDTFVARWPTKVFAMECARKVISLLSNSRASGPAHFDLFEARKLEQSGASKDFLVLNLGDLVRMAFTAATSDIEPLRPVGVYTMKDLVEKFSASMDPDYEGHPLLEQYQAQIASALRPAFTPEAPPTTAAAACSVLVSYISSNIMRDIKEILRVLNLLLAPLEKLKDITYPAYSEKATTMVQLAVLSAIAQLYITSKSGDDRPITKTEPKLATYLPNLKEYWLDFLKDYAVISISQPEASLSASTAIDPPKPIKYEYQGHFFSYHSLNDVAGYYNAAFPSVLVACASLVDTPVWTENASDEENECNFFLLLGLAVRSISIVNVKNAVAGLKAVRKLLTPSSFEKRLISEDICKELLTVLTNVLEAGDRPMQAEAAKLRADCISHIPAAFYENSDVLLDNIMDSLSVPLLKYLPELFGQQSKLSHNFDNETKVVLEASVSTFSAASLLEVLSDPAQQDYRSSVVVMLIRLCELALKDSDFPLAAKAAQVLKLVAANSTRSADWEAVLQSSISEVLNKLEPSTILEGKNSIPLLLAFFALLEGLSNETECFGLHERAVTTLKNAIHSKDIQMAALQGLRNFVQIPAAQNQARQQVVRYYLQALGPDVVFILQDIHKDRAVVNQDNEMFNLYSEAIRILVLAQSLALAAGSPAVLPLLLHSLVGLLNPASVDTLHDVVLQLLLKLAPANPNFKEQVALLPEHERQIFESSVRLLASNASPQAEKQTEMEVKVAKPLKLDFSKYA